MCMQSAALVVLVHCLSLICVTLAKHERRIMQHDTWRCVLAEYGGLCTFCGAQVALSYSQQSQTNASLPPSLQPPSTTAQAQPAFSSSAEATSSTDQQDDKEADAVAFKDRLVGYDRNAAQRTKVIDDQSDYFEIDSNTWLSKEVSRCKDCIQSCCHSCSIEQAAIA